MMERLRKYRDPLAWGLLGVCVFWSLWRVITALFSLGPAGVLGEFALSIFPVPAALAVLAGAAGLVVLKPVSDRAGLYLTVAVAYGAAAIGVALIFQLLGVIVPAHPNPLFFRLMGLVGFVALYAIPAAVTYGLWWARRRILDDRTEEVLDILPGDLGGVRREHLIEGADEPTRAIPRSEVRARRSDAVISGAETVIPRSDTPVAATKLIKEAPLVEDVEPIDGPHGEPTRRIPRNN